MKIGFLIMNFTCETFGKWHGFAGHLPPPQHRPAVTQGPPPATPLSSSIFDGPHENLTMETLQHSDIPSDPLSSPPSSLGGPPQPCVSGKEKLNINTSLTESAGTRPVGFQ